MNLLEKAQRYMKGVSILAEWLGEGGVTCPQKEAQERTDICRVCPLNDPNHKPTETIATAIKRQVEFKNSMGLRTNGIKSLHTCSACLCYLPLKIFVPKATLLSQETTQSLAAYHEKCWMRT